MSEVEREVIGNMEALVREKRSAAVLELLPDTLDRDAAIGLSVAVDALNDGNEPVAKAALEIAAYSLEGRSMHTDTERGESDS